MRWTLSLLGLAVAASGQMVFPDKFEAMKLDESRRRYDSTYSPTGEKIDQFEIKLQQEINSNPHWLQVEEPAYQPVRDPVPPAQTLSILPPRWQAHVVNTISKGITKFTLDMDRAIEDASPAGHENLIFSPASLTVTLAMILLASSGLTFKETSKILGVESGIDISKHSEILHQVLGLMIQEYDKHQLANPDLPKTKLAFGMFVEDGFPIREQFKRVSENVYKTEIMNLDFSHHNEAAQQIINEWVGNKTEGKIQKILTSPPSPLTQVIIMSALYFSGEWNQHFVEGSTKRKLFTIDENETVYVDMMFNGGTFPFYEDKRLGLKIIGFPYKGSEVTMYAILPNAEGAAELKALKRRLTQPVLDGLIGRMANKSCIIGYPKMKLSSTLKLQSALEALGLRSLFDPLTADLSVLSPGRGANFRPPKTSRFDQDQWLGPTYVYYGLGDGSSGFQVNQFADGYKVDQWWNGQSQWNPKRGGRGKRQSRPIDQEFVSFVNSHNLPSFGVDELRNTPGLSNPGIMADEVIHKVEISVDETGTRAAAATGVTLDRSGDFRKFVANRPFLFFIRHNPSKIIWFWSTINKPTPFYHSN